MKENESRIVFVNINKLFSVPFYLIKNKKIIKNSLIKKLKELTY